MLFGMWRRTNESPRRATDHYPSVCHRNAPEGNRIRLAQGGWGLASEAPLRGEGWGGVRTADIVCLVTCDGRISGYSISPSPLMLAPRSTISL